MSYQPFFIGDRSFPLLY